MKRSLQNILAVCVLVVLSLTGCSFAHDMIAQPQWLELTEAEVRSLNADQGKLHDLPLWMTPYNTARPKVPNRVDVLVDRDVYMSDDPVGQALLHFIGLPWQRPGAVVQLEVVALVDGSSRRMGVKKYPNVQSPKLAVQIGIHDLKPGKYKLVSELLGVARKPMVIGEAAFEVSSEKRYAIPFPEDGVPLKVHVQDHLPNGVYPITTGVPLPRHAADRTDEFVLLENGKPIPAQFSVRAHWYPVPGEIKWMGLDFLAKYDAGQPREYVLTKVKLPNPHANPKSNLSVVEQDGQYVVNTGAIQFVVSRKSFAGIEQVRWVNEDGAAGELLVDGKGGPFLIDERLYDYSSQLDEAATVRIEEQGPVRVTLVAEGWYTNDRDEKTCKYLTRITAYADQPQIDVYHTTVITFDTDRKGLRKLGFALKPVGAATWQFGADGKAHKGALPEAKDKKTPAESVWLHQDRHDHFRLMQGDDTKVGEGKRADGWLHTQTEQGQITVAVRNLWQLFPKELEISRDELSLHFWPKHGHDTFTREEELDNKHIHKAWYAHEGEYLDLDMPQFYFDRFPQTGIELCGPLRDGRFLEQQDINAISANAQGTAISNHFTIQFDRKDVDAKPAAKGALFQQDPHAITDPDYNGQTDVEGRFAGKDVANYPKLEWLFTDAFKGFNQSVDLLENYGMWIWPDTHNNWSLGFLAPQTHRWWLNSHYQGVWEGTFLYFRSGDEMHHVWSRDNNEHFANIGTVNYDNPIERLQGKILGANYHTKGFLPWGSARFGERTGDDYVEVGAHFINPDAHLLRYLLFGDHRKLGLMQGWFHSLGRVALPPERSREAVTALGEVISYYENTWDPQAIVYIRDLADDMNSRPWPEVPSHPGHPLFHDRWFMRYWELTHDPKLEHRLFEWFTPESERSSAKYNLPQIRAIAWRMTGNDAYLTEYLEPLSEVGLNVYDNPNDPLHGYGGRGYFFPSPSMGQMLPYYIQALREANLKIPAPVDSSYATNATVERPKDEQPREWFTTPKGVRFPTNVHGYLHILGDNAKIDLTFSGYIYTQYGRKEPKVGRLVITDATGKQLLNESIMAKGQRDSVTVTIDTANVKLPLRLRRFGWGQLAWTGNADRVVLTPTAELEEKK